MEKSTKNGKASLSKNRVEISTKRKKKPWKTKKARNTAMEQTVGPRSYRRYKTIVV
jgi:hypothetical protein